jgi:pimeloyl-ACP methyl ester carboxylesterase
MWWNDNMVGADIDVGGLSVHYREAGRGSPVVLLHGFALDGRSWRPQLSALSDAYRVVAWDAPGAGASADPPGDWATADFVDSLATFLRLVAVGPAHVVGLSWGGILAQEFYRRNRDSVRTLVLADTYAGWAGSLGPQGCADRLDACLTLADGPVRDIVAHLLPGLLSDGVDEATRDELAGIMSDLHPAGFRLMSLSSAEVDTTDLLSEVAVPTLLIWGEADARSSLEIADQMNQAIPGSELTVLRGAGHLSNLEAPQRFTAALRRFHSRYP